MLVKEDWTVAVFKCEKTGWKKVLIALVDVVDRLQKQGKAKSFHYTIREIDQTDDKPWISFRVYRDREFADDIEKALDAILFKEIGEGNYQVPPKDPEFKGHINFLPYDEPEKVATHWGTPDNWNRFCEFLNRLSVLVVDLARQDQFEGEKRQEIGHLALNMLGLREVGYTRGALFDLFAGKRERDFYPY